MQVPTPSRSSTWTTSASTKCCCCRNKPLPPGSPPCQPHPDSVNGCSSHQTSGCSLAIPTHRSSVSKAPPQNLPRLRRFYFHEFAQLFHELSKRFSSARCLRHPLAFLRNRCFSDTPSLLSPVQ